jgi:hypothetical protein
MWVVGTQKNQVHKNFHLTLWSVFNFKFIYSQIGNHMYEDVENWAIILLGRFCQNMVIN